MARYAAAVSEHPDSAVAVGEVTGQLLDRLGPAPDLVVVFLSPHHTAATDDIAGAIQEILAPQATIGATAGSVVAGARELEASPAVSVFGAAELATSPALHLRARRTNDGVVIDGVGDLRAGTLLLLADPFSFPTDLFAAALERVDGLVAVGGLASAGAMPGTNRLIVDGTTVRDGAVAVLIPPGVVTHLVSQGCRPIGAPWTVTAAAGDRLQGLGGRPALERLQELVQGLSPDDHEALRRGLHLGLVIDESRLDFAQGDFLIRGVLDVDPATESVRVGDHPVVGSTVQFQVRDAVSADEDLRALLRGRGGAGALVFSCNGRGQHLFAAADHDANLVAGAVNGGPVAGMFCAGEVGPVGGRTFLHGFTVSVAFFGEIAGLGWGDADGE